MEEQEVLKPTHGELVEAFKRRNKEDMEKVLKEAVVIFFKSKNKEDVVGFETKVYSDDGREWEIDMEIKIGRVK